MAKSFMFKDSFPDSLDHTALCCQNIGVCILLNLRTLELAWRTQISYSQGKAMLNFIIVILYGLHTLLHTSIQCTYLSLSQSFRLPVQAKHTAMDGSYFYF